MLQEFRIILFIGFALVAGMTLPACNSLLPQTQSDTDDSNDNADTNDQDTISNDDVPPLTQELKTAEGFSLFYPVGWSAAPAANVYQVVNVSAEVLATLDSSELERIAQIIVFIEQREDHEDALGRLGDIEAELPSPSTSLSIDGWPALQRRHVGLRPQPGGADGGSSGEVLLITTAVAADKLLVRLEATVPVDAAPEVGETVEMIGRSLRFEE